MKDIKNPIGLSKLSDYKKFMKESICFVITFIILFMLAGKLDNNFFLPKNNLGLFQHLTIWLFLGTNMIVPILLYIILKSLKNIISDKLSKEMYNKLKEKNDLNIIKFSSIFLQTLGFCYFIFNTLQNAQIINKLPFGYWDSIHYILSFIISRVYKLYLFSYFFPCVVINAVAIILCLSDILKIDDKGFGIFPMDNHYELNILCNTGINILLTILIPIILIFTSVYFVHNRFDIISIGTAIFSLISTIIFVSLYIFLIRNYHSSVMRYKCTQNEELNKKLSEIHTNIIKSEEKSQNIDLLTIYFEKQDYLLNCKDKVNKINPYPNIIKMCITTGSSILPTVLKYTYQFLKTFFKLL